MRVAFVTNICPHYRVRTFEQLARRAEVDYYFFSAGDEWYWQQAHGVQRGDFTFRYLPGLRLAGTRVTPTLPWHLLRGDYELYLSGISGRFALPATYLIARLRRRPLVLWTGVWARLESPFHRLSFPLTRFLYRHADAVVVYGEHVRRYLIDEGVQPERIFIAHHAIDNEAYRVPLAAATRAARRAALGVGPSETLLLFLGRLEPVKGLDVLLAAMARLQQDSARLVIAGEGSLRADLERRVDALGLTGRVRFAGYVPVEEAPSYYALADVVLLPSVSTGGGRETWGLVVNEAFNQGVPVIATDAVGAAAGGLLRHEETGLVVPERDPAALGAAIDRLVGVEPLRVRLGEAARREIALWDNERMVDGFVAALDYATRPPVRARG